jgi:hypothetical protein
METQRHTGWDYMGRILREDRIKKEVISQENMWKKEIADMQKTLQWCYIRIQKLNDEIYELKSQSNIINDDDRQLELDF